MRLVLTFVVGSLLLAGACSRAREYELKGQVLAVDQGRQELTIKHGDIRVLGAASYATPLLSTAFLILAGYAAASANIVFAAILIAGGGLIAAKDMFWKR